MITACTGCQARYRLDAAKVPNRQIRVRCPDCGTVFDLDGTLRDEPLAMVQDTFAAKPAASLASEPAAPVTPPPQPAPAQADPPPVQPVSVTDDLVLEPAAAAVDQTVQAARSPAAPRPAAARQSETSTAVAEPPRTSRRTRRDKTEMLARALVSDILVYNQEARDRALADGTLLEVLGPEIKKSWELYKEKVGAETATSTSYFKDALNDILADGKAVF